jgi:hypothetical protein
MRSADDLYGRKKKKLKKGEKKRKEEKKGIPVAAYARPLFFSCPQSDPLESRWHKHTRTDSV